MNDADRERLIATICASPTYRLAQHDAEFIESDAARGARLELEMMRPELYLQARNITSTVVVFGSARLTSPDRARENLARVRATFAKSPRYRRKARALPFRWPYRDLFSVKLA